MRHLPSVWPEIAVAIFVLIAAASAALARQPDHDAVRAAALRHAPVYPDASIRTGALLP